MQDAGLSRSGEYPVPLTQQDFGDALGVSTVHINRTLKAFRDENLVLFKFGRLRIIDIAALQDVAGFAPDYLRDNVTPAEV
jgi:CRP-like cAMP-binding protein